MHQLKSKEDKLAAWVKYLWNWWHAPERNQLLKGNPSDFLFYIGGMMNIRRMDDKQIIKKLEQSAEIYSKYADGDLLFIYRHSKEDKYSFYEVRFGKRNFMHLAGIKSKTLSAEEFFDNCLENKITIKDCSPSHNVVTRNSKIYILDSLLRFENSKCYRIGNKDLITKYNEFEMATGNVDGVIGYSQKNTREGIKHKPVPSTLLTNPITDYCSSPDKIMFVLKKGINEKHYGDVLFEISKGLFEKELVSFSEELSKYIDIK